MSSTFSTYHPVINFGFFCGVIGIGIFMIHPVFLTIGVTAAFIYAVMLGGKGTIKFFACFLLPMMIMVMVINPLVNHHGMTILFYTKHSYITLEAIVYGVLTGFMLASILLWFSCYNKIMTSDKFVYIFGRVMPAISLIFSMVMRFVPNYKMQIVKISEAQKCIGRNVSDGNVKQKARHGLKIISIMFTWALENAIDTADSMRSRGYGISGRSSFSIYRFDRRDLCAGCFLAIVIAIVIAGIVSGKCAIEFYPYIVMSEQNVFTILVYMAYFLLCFFPILVEIKEALTWKVLQSRI